MTGGVDAEEHHRGIQSLCVLIPRYPQLRRPDLREVPLVALDGKVPHKFNHLLNCRSIFSERYTDFVRLVALISKEGEAVVEPLQLQQQLNVKGRVDVIVEGDSIQLRRHRHVGCGLPWWGGGKKFFQKT